MKDYFVDYMELVKMSNAFYKKHWKGTLVLSAALIVAEFGAIKIIGDIKSKKYDNWEDE